MKLYCSFIYIAGIFLYFIKKSKNINKSNIKMCRNHIINDDLCTCEYFLYVSNKYYLCEFVNKLRKLKHNAKLNWF